MNQGTARKLCERLRSSEAQCEPSQLRFAGGGQTFMSMAGVYLDFIDPDGWSPAWDGVSAEWHGEMFAIPADAAARGKIKSIERFMAISDEARSFADAADSIEAEVATL